VRERAGNMSCKLKLFSLFDEATENEVYYGVNVESMGDILANNALNCCYGHQHFTRPRKLWSNVVGMLPF